MVPQQRMSATAVMFLGIFGVVAVGIASGTAVALYGLHVIDGKATSLIGFASDTINGLPELIESLPPAVGELLNDHRAPEYAAYIDVEVQFAQSKRTGKFHPVLTITNRGAEVVSLLAVRIAALDANGVAKCEWTEVVATPLAIDDDWRGPLLPGSKRHVVVSSWRGVVADSATEIRGAVEIADVRLWKSGNGETLTIASATNP